MKSLIYDYRFLIYGMTCGIPIGRVVAKYGDLSLLAHILTCMVIMLGLFPIISTLDNKFIKQKGDN